MKMLQNLWFSNVFWGIDFIIITKCSILDVATAPDPPLRNGALARDGLTGEMGFQKHSR